MAATETAIVVAAAMAAMAAPTAAKAALTAAEAVPTAAKAAPTAAKMAADAAVKYGRYLSLLTHDSHTPPSQLLYSTGGSRFHVDTNIGFPRFLAKKAMI